MKFYAKFDFILLFDSTRSILIEDDIRFSLFILFNIVEMPRNQCLYLCAGVLT